VVPVKDDGTVVLIRQFRHAAGGFIYEIPAGKLQPGEAPLQCASRELEEEIGYRASSFKLLVSILTAPGFADEVIHIYRGTGLTKGRQRLDRDEVLEVVEMKLAEAVRKIEDGTIRDAKTIVGLQAVYIGSIARP
jgi:ADP-ribose pyrophosphatase